MNANAPLSLPKALLTEIEHIFGSKDISRISLNQVFHTIIHYYENVLSCMPGNVYWLDQHCRALGCNQNVLDMFGLSSISDFHGLTFEAMGKIGGWSEAATLAFRQDSLEVIRTGEPKLNVEEPPIPHHNGGLIHYLTHRVPLFDEAGKVIGLVGISIDITQRKTLEEALRREKQKAEAANLAKSAFIANMSHDIRTPLNGVIGMSQLLEERTQSSECKQYARWIHESGNQLMGLLNNILDLISSDQVHEQDLHIEPFSLRSLIEDIVQLEQPSMLMKQLAFIVDIEPSIPEFLVSDRTKLHRIILNLIGNAVKFTKTGTIELRVRKDHHTDTHTTLTFSLSDTGIGIPKTMQNKIFERFFRLNPSSKGQYTGHGVGLHIVQNYIKLLGGNMHLFSEEGKGSTFSFQLTFENTSQNLSSATHSIIHTTTNQASTELERPLPPRPFLLVEDNPIALKLLEHLMEKLGHPFVSVETAEDALEKVNTHTFDLILTDIGLPGLSGIELTQRIRQSIKTHPPLIIGLTAHAAQDTYEACLNAGMNTVLTKPLDIKKLTQVMQTFFPSSTMLNQQPATLGQDLPESEASLFELSSLPILDDEEAINLLGDREVLNEMLQLMLQEQIPHDKPLLQTAYKKRDWVQIAALAHKMKAGALYCGMLRLQIACQYLERYHKAGHTQSLEALYKQLMRIIKETEHAIERQFNKG